MELKFFFSKKNNAVMVTFGKKQKSMYLFYLSSLTICHCELGKQTQIKHGGSPFLLLQAHWVFIICDFRIKSCSMLKWLDFNFRKQNANRLNRQKVTQNQSQGSVCLCPDCYHTTHKWVVPATHIYIHVCSSEGERSKINLVANEGPSLGVLPNGHLLTLTSHSARQGDKLILLYKVPTLMT